MAGRTTAQLAGQPCPACAQGARACEAGQAGSVQGDEAISGDAQRVPGQCKANLGRGWWGRALSFQQAMGRGAASTQAWGRRGSGCLWRVMGSPQILPGGLRVLWDAVNLRVREGGARLSQRQRPMSAGAGGVAPGGEEDESAVMGPTAPHPTGGSRRAKFGPGRGSGEGQVKAAVEIPQAEIPRMGLTFPDGLTGVFLFGRHAGAGAIC